jgi:hypothetical protein
MLALCHVDEKKVKEGIEGAPTSILALTGRLWQGFVPALPLSFFFFSSRRSWTPKWLQAVPFKSCAKDVKCFVASSCPKMFVFLLNYSLIMLVCSSCVYCSFEFFTHQFIGVRESCSRLLTTPRKPIRRMFGRSLGAEELWQLAP